MTAPDMRALDEAALEEPIRLALACMGYDGTREQARQWAERIITAFLAAQRPAAPVPLEHAITGPSPDDTANMVRAGGASTSLPMPAQPSRIAAPADSSRVLSALEARIAAALHHLQADGAVDRGGLASVLRDSAAHLAALEAVAVAFRQALIAMESSHMPYGPTDSEVEGWRKVLDRLDALARLDGAQTEEKCQSCGALLKHVPDGCPQCRGEQP